MTGRLASLLDEGLERGSGAVVEDPGGRLDAGGILARAGAVAAELARHGIGRNEPVLVSVGNRAADFAALLGTWRAGAVAVPVHATTPGRVLESFREATGVRLLLDGETGEAARVADAPPPGRALLDGAALVIFTSGSTGAPKGVVIGHDGLAGKLDVLRSVLGIEHGPHTLLPLQVTFIFGIWVSLVTVLAGGRLTMMPKFTPAAARAALGSGVTTAAFVPTMLRALFSEAAPPPAAPELTRILTGGEPLGEGLGTRIARSFPAADLYDLYGLTETGSCDFCVTPDLRAAAHGTIGMPTPGVAFRIAEPADAGAGGAGELLIRTPYGMLGYLDRPDLTAASFDDGWFRTGDLARRRPDGTVELAGRAKDIVSRGGNKIAPLEIDRLFCSHPDVVAALAAGVPDPLLGERLHVMVVPRAGAAVDARSLAEWAAERIERFKIPDVFHFSAELPLGRTGKADRGALRDWIAQGTRSG